MKKFFQYLKTHRTPIKIITFSIIFVFVLFSIFIVFFSIQKFSPAIGPIETNYDQLVKGLIGYNIEDTMEIGKDYYAKVSITKSFNRSVLYHGLDSNDFHINEISISSRVKAMLLDPSGNKNFDIVALNTEEQIVDDSMNTIWNWNVRPIRAGGNDLILRVTVRILDRLGDNYRDIDVFYKTIKVEASFAFTAKQFISDYWQWLSTACIIPMIIWGYKNFKSRKKKMEYPRPIGFQKPE